MATTKVKDLRELSVDEINRRIRDLKTEAIQLKLQKATSALDNPSRTRAIRREHARLLTLLAERKTKA
jgi:large subunit ribosomal protein L29